MRPISWYLVLAMFIIGIAPGVHAAMAPSELVAAQAMDRTQDMQKIRQVIETKMVRDRLEALGFSEGEITSRLDRMDDHEVHQLAQRLDQIKAGGDGLGIIIALLVIAILVVILLQITGHKVIIK
jgi:hypothetical protein